MSTSPVPHGAPPACLQAEDLIDDHELATVDEDRLAHAGIADQLAALVRTVKTPSNIALYGPWGSGKSGIANLLKAKVDNKDGIRFARFDAFKYAELPFRRNFVSAVATELGHSEGEYHDDLYNGRTKTDVSVPATTVLKILVIFGLLTVGLSVIIGVVVAAIAWLQEGDFGDSFKSMSKTVVLAGLVPAALLSALITLASKTFQVDRSIAKPESDEQFEQLFKSLVADSKAKRLVIFVDELDRCSASEVVATLDTVRTFLGVEKCVFVIAADQQVLEEALTRAARQETPTNDANPYYSTGSAYLDKVFQYQLSLPPLLSQSVNNYATTLLRNRGGLWADINAEYVVSVLIPTHVTSPRRVKHLLNTFALTYRLAEERHRSQLLAEDPRQKAAAIARLTCLRVEFPIFARHLEVDANLPDLVLKLVGDPGQAKPPGVSDQAWDIAKGYALENAAPDRLLTDDQTDEEDDEEEAENARETAAVHNKQLLNYLSRTRRVRGPSRDLIYQQSSGTVFGLDGEVAVTIENAAEDGDIDALHRIISGLDEAGQEAAIELLSQHIRTGLGVAGPNTARSLLLLLERLPALPTTRVVDIVCESITVMHDDDNDLLDGETIESAWSLAKSGSDTGAAALRALVTTVVSNGDEWDEAPEFLLDDVVFALDAAPDAAIQYVTNAVAAVEGEAARDRLFSLPDDELIVVLGSAQQPITDQLAALLAARDAWDQEQEAASRPAAATTTSAAAPATADPTPEPPNPEGILTSFAQHAKDRETPVQHQVLRLLLTTDHVQARNAAISLIRATEPVTEPDLVSLILTAATRRVIVDLPPWFHGIAPAGINATHASDMSKVAQVMWDGEDGEFEHTVSALTAFEPLRDALPADKRPDVSDYAIGKVDFWARTNAEASALVSPLKRIHLFEAVGLIEPRAVAAAVVSSLFDTVANKVPVAGPGEPLFDYVNTEGVAAVKTSPPDHEALEDILANVEASPWLSEVHRLAMMLAFMDAAGISPNQTAYYPTADTIVELVTNHESAAAPVASEWVRLASPTPEHLAAIYELLREGGAVTTGFAEAAHAAQAHWSEDDRESFARRYLTQPDAPVPSNAELKVIGLAAIDDQTAAQILSDRFAASTNNTQRQSVVTLWKKAEIDEDAARRSLIESVIFGLLDLHVGAASNTGAVEMALNALNDLGEPLPWGVKGELGDRVRQAVGDSDSLNNKALRVMPTLGYGTAKTGWFKRTKRVDFDAD